MDRRLIPTITASEEEALLLGRSAVVLWRMDPQPAQQGSYAVVDGDRERPAWLSWCALPDIERLVGPTPTWHQEDTAAWVGADEPRHGSLRGRERAAVDPCRPGGTGGPRCVDAARREFAEETGPRALRGALAAGGPDGFTVTAEPFWCGDSHDGKPMWAYEAELNHVDWSTVKRWFGNDGEVRMVPVRGIAAHYVPEFLPVARRVLGAYLLHREETG